MKPPHFVVVVAALMLGCSPAWTGKREAIVREPSEYVEARPTFDWAAVSERRPECVEPFPQNIDGASYPNPFSFRAAVEIRVRNHGGVRVDLLCKDSSTVGSLYSGELSVGLKLVVWSGADVTGSRHVPGGNYLCLITLPDTSYVQPLRVH